MSLSPESIPFEDYFTNALLFFKNNDYLYNYANTDILLNDSLSKIPKECFQDFNVNGNKKIDNIFKDFNRLLPPKKEYEYREDKDSKISKSIKGLSSKKCHEISNFSRFIGEECSSNNISLVIDLGCGLGYVTQLLFKNYGLQVLGIEADKKRVITAIDRQKTMHENSIGFVHYVEHFITADSSQEIVQFLNQYFPERDFYLIGLHACADLTIDAINLFLEMPRCKGLAIMPCCYHRMKLREQKNDALGEFINIPLSKSLKTAFLKCDARKFIRQPFLRLCCQRATWRENEQNLNSRVFHLMSRAVLQLYARKENLKIIKQKRRAVSRLESRKCNFDSFVKNAVFHGYEFESAGGAPSDIRLRKNEESNGGGASAEEAEVGDTSSINADVEGRRRSKEDIVSGVTALWESLRPEDFSAASLLIRLQDSLQAHGEDLVLMDKLAYLRERGDPSMSSDCVKIVDESVSPRCHALVARKARSDDMKGD